MGISTSPVADYQRGAFDKVVAQAREDGWLNGAEVVCARSPGRLDVMGGVSDYQGAIVLEGTLQEASLAAVQERDDGAICVRSVGVRDDGLDEEALIEVADLVDCGVAVPFDQAAARLRTPPSSRWTGYVAGCVHVLVLSGWLQPERLSGLNILLSSNVPLGAGVSSSAAIEVSTMHALCGLYGLTMDGVELARLCQLVENRVVGAPCGIMDQVTSALGRDGYLVVLKCQPHDVLGHQAVPPGWRVLGIDSRVKHSVGGGNYTHARVASFMALGVVQALSQETWGGYLCNIAPETWSGWRERVPESLTGAEYLRQYGGWTDPVTAIDPEQTYRVRDAAEHHIVVNDRVREFLALMQCAGEGSDQQLLKEAGALMLDTHRSYSDRIGLGSEETDLIADLALERGPSGGLYGARITGGGSGGTVAVLASGPRVEESVAAVVDAYRARTGIEPGIMAGSSPGALQFGHWRI
ncbi:MAG TPA: hypothetical protein VLH79_04125 [Chthonomonadales bacterium]|nr:hypothetical protein [Chthonomonadales bacterium]